MRSAREAWERLTRPVRAVRSALRRWSSGSDREFHDRLFDQIHYDPFSKSYPGYLTIRRFADHLQDRLDDVRSVVNLGCLQEYGPRTDAHPPPGMRAVVPALPLRPAMRGLLPPYGATYNVTRAPATASKQEVFTIDVRVKNTGWMAWNEDAAQPVLLSYHWLDAAGQTLAREGLRTPVPAVESGQEVSVALRVEAPEHPGSASLSIELVHEDVTWFADQGVTPAAIAIRILD